MQYNATKPSSWLAADAGASIDRWRQRLQHWLGPGQPASHAVPPAAALALLARAAHYDATQPSFAADLRMAAQRALHGTTSAP